MLTHALAHRTGSSTKLINEQCILYQPPMVENLGAATIFVFALLIQLPIQKKWKFVCKSRVGRHS